MELCLYFVYICHVYKYLLVACSTEVSVALNYTITNIHCIDKFMYNFDNLEDTTAFYEYLDRFIKAKLNNDDTHIYSYLSLKVLNNSKFETEFENLKCMHELFSGCSAILFTILQLDTGLFANKILFFPDESTYSKLKYEKIRGKCNLHHENMFEELKCSDDSLFNNLKDILIDRALYIASNETYLPDGTGSVVHTILSRYIITCIKQLDDHTRLFHMNNIMQKLCIAADIGPLSTDIQILRNKFKHGARMFHLQDSRQKISMAYPHVCPNLFKLFYSRLGHEYLEQSANNKLGPICHKDVTDFYFRQPANITYIDIFQIIMASVTHANESNVNIDVNLIFLELNIESIYKELIGTEYFKKGRFEPSILLTELDSRWRKTEYLKEVEMLISASKPSKGDVRHYLIFIASEYKLFCKNVDKDDTKQKQSIDYYKMLKNNIDCILDHMQRVFSSGFDLIVAASCIDYYNFIRRSTCTEIYIAHVQLHNIAECKRSEEELFCLINTDFYETSEVRKNKNKHVQKKIKSSIANTICNEDLKTSASIGADARKKCNSKRKGPDQLINMAVYAEKCAEPGEALEGNEIELPKVIEPLNKKKKKGKRSKMIFIDESALAKATLSKEDQNVINHNESEQRKNLTEPSAALQHDHCEDSIPDIKATEVSTEPMHLSPKKRVNLTTISEKALEKKESNTELEKSRQEITNKELMVYKMDCTDNSFPKSDQLSTGPIEDICKPIASLKIRHIDDETFSHMSQFKSTAGHDKIKDISKKSETTKSEVVGSDMSESEKDMALRVKPGKKKNIKSAATKLHGDSLGTSLATETKRNIASIPTNPKKKHCKLYKMCHQHTSSNEIFAAPVYNRNAYDTIISKSEKTEKTDTQRPMVAENSPILCEKDYSRNSNRIVSGSIPSIPKNVRSISLVPCVEKYKQSLDLMDVADADKSLIGSKSKCADRESMKYNIDHMENNALHTVNSSICKHGEQQRASMLPVLKDTDIANPDISTDMSSEDDFIPVVTKKSKFADKDKKNSDIGSADPRKSATPFYKKPLSYKRPNKIPDRAMPPSSKSCEKEHASLESQGVKNSNKGEKVLFNIPQNVISKSTCVENNHVSNPKQPLCWQTIYSKDFECDIDLLSSKTIKALYSKDKFDTIDDSMPIKQPERVLEQENYGRKTYESNRHIRRTVCNTLNDFLPTNDRQNNAKSNSTRVNAKNLTKYDIGCMVPLPRTRKTSSAVNLNNSENEKSTKKNKLNCNINDIGLFNIDSDIQNTSNSVNSGLKLTDTMMRTDLQNENTMERFPVEADNKSKFNITEEHVKIQSNSIYKIENMQYGVRSIKNWPDWYGKYQAIIDEMNKTLGSSSIASADSESIAERSASENKSNMEYHTTAETQKITTTYTQSTSLYNEEMGDANAYKCHNRAMITETVHVPLRISNTEIINLPLCKSYSAYPNTNSVEYGHDRKIKKINQNGHKHKKSKNIFHKRRQYYKQLHRQYLICNEHIYAEPYQISPNDNNEVTDLKFFWISNKLYREYGTTLFLLENTRNDILSAEMFSKKLLQTDNIYWCNEYILMRFFMNIEVFFQVFVPNRTYNSLIFNNKHHILDYNGEFYCLRYYSREGAYLQTIYE